MLSYNDVHAGHSNSSNRSLKQQIFRVVILAFVVLTTYVLISDYYNTLYQIEKLTLNRLEGIVAELAIQIDGDLHQSVVNRNEHMDDILNNQVDEEYQQIHQKLKQTHQSHQLTSPIYTFIKTPNTANKLEFIATSSDVPYFRHAYTSMPKKGYKMLNYGGSLGSYEDEFGNWLSAFAPIRNSQGETVAFVQADEKFDTFLNEVRAKTIRNALFSLVGLSITSWILILYLRLILKKEYQQKVLLEQTLAKTQKLSLQLESSEQQLKENAIKLEQSNKDLTDFAHIASHDLKAPLRTIHSFAQLLRRRLNKHENEEVQEYIAFILSNANRAQKLINGLLQYSTADKNLGEQIVFPISDAAEEARQSLIAKVKESNARIVFSEMPLIKANLTLISQVMQNLINNGIKYNQSDNPIVEIGAGKDPAYGQFFFVKDNGIGIAKAYQKNIFKMFTRLHNSDKYEGSGIGLAFCARVVEAYGGKMWLESSEGKGSTFYFTLPNAIVKPTIIQTAASALKHNS